MDVLTFSTVNRGGFIKASRFVIRNIPLVAAVTN